MSDDYGIKVMNVGADVTSTDIRDQIMNSQYSMFKYHSDSLGTVTINSGGTVGYGTIAHNLGYVPAFLPYINYTGDSAQRIVPSIPYAIDFDNWADAYAGTQNVVVGFHLKTPFASFNSSYSELFEELGSGGIGLIVGASGGSGYSSCVRFTNVTISGTATISSSEIEWTHVTSGDTEQNTKFKVWGIDEDNTGELTDSSCMSRTKTTANVVQEQSKQSGYFNYSSNTKAIVEEILARPNWDSGNAMGFIINDNSSPDGANIISNADTDIILKITTSDSLTVTFRAIIFKDKII